MLQSRCRRHQRREQKKDEQHRSAEASELFGHSLQVREHGYGVTDAFLERVCASASRRLTSGDRSMFYLLCEGSFGSLYTRSSSPAKIGSDSTKPGKNDGRSPQRGGNHHSCAKSGLLGWAALLPASQFGDAALALHLHGNERLAYQTCGEQVGSRRRHIRARPRGGYHKGCHRTARFGRMKHLFLMDGLAMLIDARHAMVLAAHPATRRQRCFRTLRPRSQRREKGHGENDQQHNGQETTHCN